MPDDLTIDFYWYDDGSEVESRWYGPLPAVGDHVQWGGTLLRVAARVFHENGCVTVWVRKVEEVTHA